MRSWVPGNLGRRRLLPRPEGEARPRWPRLLGKSRRARGSRAGRLELHCASCVARGQEATGQLSCDFFDPLVAVPVHGCPWLPLPLRTQREPRDRFIRLASSPALGVGSTKPGSCLVLRRYG
jgi:hypothetical protein